MPLYELAASAFPQFKECVDEMRGNLHKWEDRAAKWYTEPVQQDSSLWEQKQVKGKLEDLLKAPPPK